MDALEFVRVRELEVAVRIWNPTAPRTLIAWHGLARHGGDFSALARELGSEWRILAPDTPGRGLSSWSLFPAHDYLYSHYVTVAIALLDHFELEYVDWLGTSMGGLLGMLIAADPQYSARISRLILNDVGPELNTQGLIGLSSYFGVTHRFSTFSELQQELNLHYASFGITGESARRELALNSARRLPDGSWTYHFDPRIGEQFVHDTPRDMWADWVAIRCPVMVIRGEESTLLDPETLPRMAEAHPKLVTLSVPNCGHAPMLDKPAQVDPIHHFLTPPAPRPTPVYKMQNATRWQRAVQWLAQQWRRWWK
ncbi:alpha/beta fold hydrolase [Vreelandella boliviensis]|uniref:Alpha/beta hydrolase n=1 Tax=Vreelandella boliviensis LC1 TaxID=1072583 RepID=A0A265DX69_9GAMM|nr:alpha/beta hydrolase [Halomonas boliviensis]EHJ93199.1 Serine hydrolase-like protein [Halomonas boliviensis LC1]OZT73806.1 alpha/beta hydrolase [Halomonas boliviensis LC1]